VRRSGITAALIASIIVIFHASASAVAGVPRKPSSKAEVLKEAVVAAASLFAVRPELRTDSRVVERVTTIESVLALLDGHNEPDSLDVLTSLSSYYLGEAAGGLYRCLIIRKGATIKGRLASLLASDDNECARRFNSLPPSERRAACLDDVVYRAKLRAMLGQIERGETCDELP